LATPAGRLGADAVEKPCDKHGGCNNRIRAIGCLNRCCVRDLSIEWKLLLRPPQIVFQQHPPKAEMRVEAETKCPLLLIPLPTACSPGFFRYFNKAICNQTTERVVVLAPQQCNRPETTRRPVPINGRHCIRHCRRREERQSEIQRGKCQWSALPFDCISLRRLRLNCRDTHS
jgi:hypothetical protein